jgi:hypothetical protein
MASIEFINKRIEGKQKEITKLEKKLTRIIKAQESNWENNPYYYTESDLKWAKKDLEEAKAALAKYQADLTTETEKDNSRNVEAIIEFLNKWADRVFDWYIKEFANYQVAFADYRMKVARLEDMGTVSRDSYKEYKEVKKKFDSRWNFLYAYIDAKRRFDTEKLHRELEQDKKAKYDDIVNRANKICGTITDATGLSVGEKGELNGLVIGDRGTAYIETIGAGGYNIQCYHFRTLIHERK